MFIPTWGTNVASDLEISFSGTLIINQQMHYIKFHIKTLKIAPTCFDPKIILRNESGYGVLRVLRSESLSLRNTRRTPQPDAVPTTYSFITQYAATTPC